MSQQILQVDQAMLETTLDRMVRKSVEETLNAMLDAEADEITGAARYERSGERKAYRAGHYERDLTVKAGKMSLKVPKLKGAVFESAVIERYRRREESVEEALIDMYLAGVSTGSARFFAQIGCWPAVGVTFMPLRLGCHRAGTCPCIAGPTTSVR